MRSVDALQEFESRLTHLGAPATPLTPDRGVRAMLEFFRSEPANDCGPDQQGDMLLYQWGTHDWGQGDRFEFDITRQFINGAGEDEDISQLSLTFVLTPTPQLRELGSGNKWCETPRQLSEFESFITQSGAFRAVSQRTDAAVELDFGCAG